MQVLRKTTKYQLNKGSLQAEGLFNVSSIDDNATELSLWFDVDLKRTLIKMSASDFNVECKRLCTCKDFVTT